MKISTYIENDLRAKIQSGADLPCNLTLASLSDFYRVSLMPVRVAVQGLIDGEFFHKQKNGRLAINPDKLGTRRSAKEPADVTPPTDWYRTVWDDVIRQSLQGRSAHLKIASTAERYGISRTLVHSIFHRLAGAGVLVHLPRRGWRVRPFREGDLDAYIEVREVLELRALELARGRMDADELLALMERNRPGDGREPTRFDNGVHRYWIDLSHNRYIRDFFDCHGAYYDALLEYAALGEPLLTDMARQHRAILQTLLRRQWDRGRELLAFDIQRLRPILKDTIQRLGATGDQDAVAVDGGVKSV